MKSGLFLFLLLFWTLSLGRTVTRSQGEQRGAPLVRGITVYGMDDERKFPLLVRDSVDNNGNPVRSNQYVTIQFDVLADEPPRLKLRFFHCDRNWKPDQSVFLQDEYHNTSFVLNYKTSPGGVNHYRYRYLNSFPDNEDVVRFEYSGNWIFKLMAEDESNVYGEGRFMVIDRVAPTRLSVTNDYRTANVPPFNQIHKVAVTVKLPREIDGSYYTTVDVYQNRRLGHPYRIDANDRDPYTFVEGYNTGKRIFTLSGILPGNEYRTLDLSNVTRYPNNALVRPVDGADQMRMYWRTGTDRNGTAVLNRFSGINSDYIEVLFRLDLTEADFRTVTSGGKDIFLVGPFNAWEPTPEDKLVYDDAEHSYVTKKLLRRGIYDYQYVTGIWDVQMNMATEQDWLVLEGNDWRTTNTYTAFVYYNDPRFGGFDRLVGFDQARSAPGTPGSQ